MGQAIAVRQDFTATELRRLATRTRMWPRHAVAGDSGDPGWRAACGSGADRRNGPADAAGLGDPVHEHGPEGLINRGLAWRTTEA